MTDDKLSANAVLQELKKCGISYVISLPDDNSNALFSTIQQDPSLTLVPVCREGETFAIAAGLQLGNKEPLILIQNTGFLESGDSIRVIALGYKLPQLIMVSYRGWKKNGIMTDSAGIYIEPILNAWGIKYYLVTSSADISKIPAAHQEAHTDSKPVVILTGGGMLQ